MIPLPSRGDIVEVNGQDRRWLVLESSEKFDPFSEHGKVSGYSREVFFEAQGWPDGKRQKFWLNEYGEFLPGSFPGIEVKSLRRVDRVTVIKEISYRVEE